MPLRLRGADTAVLVALALFGCGAPDELSDEDSRRIRAAGEGIDDAIDTHETLRTSTAEARRLRARVRAIVARGEFESEPLDEFGLAAAGELQMLVPSLVFTDERGTPTGVDRAAIRSFLRFATTDSTRALAGPARRRVGAIERVVEESDADAETRIPPPGRVAPGDRTVGELLERIERELRPAFPGLAGDLPSVS